MRISDQRSILDPLSSPVGSSAALLDSFPHLESAIAIPTGLVHTTRRKVILQDCLSVLTQAEEACWTVLSLTACNGSVTQFREAAMSLASILAFQINLGKSIKRASYVVPALLGEARRPLLRTPIHIYLD
jgi:hypothetical protein